jgi:C_GCAxxG_C_C family probable redox protein
VREEIMGRAESAVACFNQGFNCAQAILSTYGEVLGLDRENALKLSCGLGAGMGRMQETCGAVTGAYLVIGLRYGQCSAHDSDAKEKTYQLVREFSERFTERNASTNCRELLGTDLINGDQETASRRVGQVCPNAVRDAAEILEVLLGIEFLEERR